MIRTLKKKFVLTAMFSLTILLAILILAVSAVSYINTDKAMDEALSTIIDSHYDRFPKKEEPKNPTFGYSLGPSPDLKKDSFVVYVTESQMTISEMRMNSDNIDEAEIKAYAEIIIASDNEKGKIGSYKYLKKNFGKTGTKIAFIDVSVQMHMLTDIIRTSCFAALVLLCIMFVIVYLISSKAVKPIAQNIEKQKQFITNAGHEIKTPLAIITANAEAWEINPSNAKYVTNIKEQTDRLGHLTNQLLMLAKSDETKGAADKTDICLSNTVFDSLNEFEGLLGERRFTSEISADIHICANEMQVKEIVNILLDNAVKYSSVNSDISVKLEQNQNMALLTVENETDSLPDVPPETLFERFYRFDESRNSNTGGNGIGLSIAQEFTNANGGKISAEFKGNNKILFTVAFKGK